MRFCSFILLSVFLLHAFSRTALIAGYKLNRPAYESLCANKDKPQLDCHGKCHFEKQLRQETDKEKAPSFQVKDKSDCISPVQLASLDIYMQESASRFFYSDTYTFFYSLKVFHPPLS